MCHFSSQLIFAQVRINFPVRFSQPGVSNCTEPEPEQELGPFSVQYSHLTWSSGTMWIVS